MADERIRVVVDGDAKGLGKAAAESVAAIKSIDAAAQKAERSQRAHNRTLRDGERDSNRYAVSLEAVDDAITRVNRNFTFTRNILATIKFPALAAGAGVLAAELANVAAGLTAVVSAAGPSVGVLAAIPQAATAAVQGLGTVKLASQGVGDALKAQSEAQATTGKTAEQMAADAEKLEQAMAGLSPQARAFVEQLGDLRDEIGTLRDAGAAGLFGENDRDGLRGAVTAASANLDVLNGIVEQTGEVFGETAESIGEFLGSSGFGRDLEVIGTRNAQVLERGGRALVNMLEATTDLMINAGPMVDWITRGTVGLSRQAEQWARTSRETGSARDFFEQTMQVLDQLQDIGDDVIDTLGNIGQASYDSGRLTLDSLQRVTQEWQEWTGSVEGQNQLREYFEGARPILEETGGLLADVTSALFRIGSQEATADLVRQLRSEMVPALEELLDNLADTLGPELVDALTDVVRLFAELSEEGGGLAVTVRLIGDIVEGITWIIDQGGPGMHQALGVGLAGLTLYKLLGIGAAIKGIEKLISMLPKLRAGAAVGAGAAAAGAAAGAAGVGAGTAAGAAGAAGAAAGAGGASAAGRTVLTQVGRRALGPIGVYLAAAEAINAITPDIEELTLKLDNLATPNPNGDARNDQIVKLTRALDDAVKAGDPKRIRAVANELERLGGSVESLNDKQVSDVAREIRQFATNKAWEQTRRQVDQTAREFDLMRSQTEGNVRNIRGAVDINMARITATMGQKSDAAKAALADNFRQAAEQVRDSMQDGTISTRDGLAEIERLMTRALRLYGFSREGARNIAQGQRYDGGANEGSAQSIMNNKKAGGGWVGPPGARGRDEVDITVGVGEGVVNADQQAHINQALADAHALGLSRYSSLDGLFRGETRPHYMAAPDFGGSFARGGIVALGRRLQRQGISVSEHPAFGGVAPVHRGRGHYEGRALDLNVIPPGPGDSREAAIFDRLAPQLKREGWLVLWRVANHAPGDNSHMHVEDTGQGGGLGVTTEMVEDIRRVRWKGPGGALGKIGQGALDAVRRGANQRLRAIAAQSGDEITGAGGGGGRTSAGGAYNKRELQRLWIQAGGPRGVAPLMAAIALAESGGNPSARNPSGASGLWQILGLPFPGDPMDPLTNARMAVAKYRSQGLGAWEAYTRGMHRPFMARGGRARSRFARSQTRAASRAAAAIARARLGRGRKPKKPPRRKRATRHLAAADGFAGRAEDRDTALGLLIRAQDQSVEQPTATGPVSGFSDEQLLTAYSAADLPKLRAQPDLEVEIVDQAAIGQHVGELEQRIGVKTEIGGLIAQQRDALAAALGEMQPMIAEKAAALSELKDRLRANIAEIKDLRRRLRERRQDLREVRSKLRQRGLSRSARRGLRDREESIERDVDNITKAIGALEGENTRLGRRITDRSSDLRDWRGTRDTAAEEHKRIVSFEIPSINLDIGDIAGEISEWRGTKVTPPKIDEAPNLAEHTRLLEERNRELLASSFLKGQQLQALQGFMPLLTGRILGSFAHGTGPGGIPQTGLYMLHKDEHVIPDPKGPYGSQIGGGAPAQVTVIIEGDIGPLLGKVRAEIDDRAAPVTQQRVGRSTRLILAAPGR